MLTPPRCPKCGQTNASELSHLHEHAPEDVLGLNGPTAIRYVLKCPCGAAFTHTEKVGPPDSSVVLPRAHST